MLILCAMLLLMPLSSRAEDLPDFLSAVSQGLSEGFAQGAAAVSAAGQELTLEMTTQDSRIEEGQTLVVTLSAGNPFPSKIPVAFTLLLPQQLSSAESLSWEAELDAASVDPHSGALIPSKTTFTREITLAPGSQSEQIVLCAEMSMGTRFYRAQIPLDLCVPHISASADVLSDNSQYIRTGEAFAYEIRIKNDGAAAKDVPVSLLLPSGVSPKGELPAGFSLRERTVEGVLFSDVASEQTLRIALQVDADALDDDKDASRLLSGALSVDGVRVALPRLRAVAPVISAKLTAPCETLSEGETTDLIITVVNTGLAPAQVELSCLLPKGLTLAENAGEESEEAPIALPGNDDSPSGPDAAPAMADAAPPPKTRAEDGAYVFSLDMDAARETDSGVAAATKEIHLRVRADAPHDHINKELLGAALTWRTDEGRTQMSEAQVVRISGAGFMGLSDSEWNGILLAALLMLVTVCCLHAALKDDKDEDDYCFE